MSYRNTLWSYVMIVICFLALQLQAQVQPKFAELDLQFTSYDIIEVNAASICAQLRAPQRNPVTYLRINQSTELPLRLENSGIISENYTLTVATENGITRSRGCSALPMKGVVDGQPGSEVSLTFDDHFIYGYIRIGMNMYYIEPLSHFVKNEPQGRYVVYSVRDIKPGKERKCAYDAADSETRRIRKQVTNTGGQRMPGGCFIVEVNTGSDFSMFSNYGLTGTQNHNIGVLNNVQTNYDNEFPDALQLQMGEQWISTCSTCDPWTSSLDPGAFLDDFTSWALSGFSVGHDVASCWTRRDFTGGTIGLAWVGVVCTQYKYNVLQDFSSNAELKRVLMAHEMGHNFDASHNTGIMAPSVSTATNWSSTSVSEIEAHYLSVGCLSNCTSGTAPSPDFTFVLTNPCEPATMEYTALAPNANTWEWTFDGGNPGFSTLQNPVVEYSTAGVFNVTLEVSNAFGSNSTTVPVYVGVIPNAIANFQYNINNHVVSFNFTGSGANTFNWDFGDGTPPSTAANPVHTYPLNGTYDVTLEVGNACGTNSITIPVTISVLPVANFSAVPLSGCQPMSVAFTNLSTNAVTYSWSFPGGTPSTSTAATPIVVYNSPGFHTVTLEATNSTGTTIITKTDYISVDPLPVGGFTSVVNGPTATFTQQTTAADTITWHFGDGQSSNAWNPVHTYTTNDTFTVTQVLTNGCGTTQYSQQVVIAAPPQPSFTPSGQDTLCIGQGIQFVSTTTNNPQSYLWTFEGGTPATSTDSIPFVSYMTPGTYDVTLVVTNSFGSSQMTISDQITVNTIPSVSYTYVASDLTATFTSNVINGGDPLWQFGDGAISSDPNPVHTYAGEGNYFVSLHAENVCGDSLYTQTIPVFFFPEAIMQVSNDSVCFSQSINYSGQSSSGTNQWSWVFQGGNPSTSALQNPVVSYVTPGEFQTTLIVSNPAGADTIEQLITVLPDASAAIDVTQSGLTVNCSFTGMDQDSVLWQFGDGTNATILNPQHTYNASGTYLITLIAYNACGNDTTSRQVIFLPSSTNAIAAFNDVVLLPNPTTGLFYLKTDLHSLDPVSVEVRDVLGKPVFQMQQVELLPGSPVSFDISHYPAGAYMVSIGAKQQRRMWLLIKTD